MTAATYSWASGYPARVDAEIAGEELERIRAEHDGSLTPDVVVAAAEDESAPLHPCFTWDDAEAGVLFREGEARSLVRSLRVIRVTRGANAPPMPRRAYVSVSRTPVTTEAAPAQRQVSRRNYVTTEQALGDAAMRDEVLRRALAELRSFSARYRELQELAGLVDEIDRTLEMFEETTATESEVAQ